MPASEKSKRALRTTSRSCSSPIGANTGVECATLVAGLAVCAATQIEQEEASDWVGWL